MSNVEIESNNSVAAANSLTSGVGMTGQASSSSDVDYYKLYMSSAGTAQFSLSLPSSNYNSYTVDLYDTSGVLQRSYTTSSGGDYSIASQQSGNVYAKISSYYGRDDYQISALSAVTSGNVEIESNNSVAAANSLTSGVGMTGQASSSSDVDYYKLYMSSAGTAQFSLSLPSSNYNSYTVDLYDTSGVLQRSYTTSSGGDYSIASQQSGNVYAKISSYYGRDDYQISALSAVTSGNVEIESNNSVAAANSLTSGVGMTGQASSSSDVDYYKLYMSSAGTAQFSLSLPSSNYNSYTVDLYDTSGVLQRSYTTSSGGDYSIASQQSGNVYAKISSYYGRDDYQISALSAVTLGNVEIESNNSVAAANSLTSGVGMTGQASSSSDVDYYKLYMSSAGTAQFSLSLPSSNYNSYTVDLYDTSGVLQRSYTTSSGGDYSIASQQSGNVYAKISSYYGRDDYQISALSAVTSGNVEIESNNSVAAANSLTSGVGMTGQASSSSDVDYYKLYMSSAGTAQFSLSLPSSNYNSYTVDLYDTSGVLQRSYTTSSGGDYSIASQQSGNVYAKISSYYGRDDYQISATPNFISNVTYSLASINPSINEGSTATFTLTTTNIATATSVPYSISGVSTADVSGSVLSGTAFVNSSGLATISIFLLNDFLTEGTENLVVSAGGSYASVLINDTSIAATIPATFSVSGPSNVEEGNIANFSISISGNTSAAKTIYFSTLAGTASRAAGDYSIISDYAVTFSPGGPTTQSVAVQTTSDYIVEGTEYFQGVIYEAIGNFDNANYLSTSNAVSLTDKASVVQTFSLASSNTTVSEGAAATFILTTSNVAAGTSIEYFLYGATTSDVNGGILRGTTTVAADGRATITIPVASDNTTEGAEVFTVLVIDQSASISVLDTSKGVVTPSFELTSSATSVNEGGLATFDLKTTNVDAGNSIAYQITGITSGDVVGGLLSGIAVVNTNGQATIQIPIAADNFTEADETLTLQVQDQKSSILVKDTSQNIIASTYLVEALTESVNEGSIAGFRISTTGVEAGSSISYEISGIQSTDITGAELSGNVTVGKDGLASVTVPLALDRITEGIETLKVSVQGKSAFLKINDTSNGTNSDSSAIIKTVATPDQISLNLAVDSTLISLSYKSEESWILSTLGSLGQEISGFKRLQLSNKNYALDINGVGGQAYRMYKAAFNRIPDEEGLGYWIFQMDEGLTIEETAAKFIDSPEFDQKYGINLNNLDFVKKTYQNVLGREPDPEGLSWWLGQLNSGTKDRAKILADFSEISENKLGVLALQSAGIGFIPFKPEPEYKLVAISEKITEGEVAIFSLVTQYVPFGTPLEWKLSGIQAADIRGELSEPFIMPSTGQINIYIQTEYDVGYEPDETLSITIEGQSASILIVGATSGGGGSGGSGSGSGG